MNLIKQLNLLVSFLLELILLFSVGSWGYHNGGNLVLNYTLALALPTVVAVIWGIWAAPKSTRRLKNPARTILKLSLFFAGAWLVYLAGNLWWGVVFAAVAALNGTLAFMLKQNY